MEFKVDPHSRVPPFQQVIDVVLDAIARAELVPGDRLPSVRDLAMRALVNPNTVAKAYRELGVRGVVVGRPGAGVFVTVNGPWLAQEARRVATALGFKRATEEALRAGHSLDALQEVLDESAPDRLAGSGRVTKGKVTT